MILAWGFIYRQMEVEREKGIYGFAVGLCSGFWAGGETRAVWHGVVRYCTIIILSLLPNKREFFGVAREDGMKSQASRWGWSCGRSDR